MFKEKSIPAIFQNRVMEYGDSTCVYSKIEDKYTALSWKVLNKKIISLAQYLISKGIKPGDPVGLFSPNRHEWWVADQAILSVGAINVPIYFSNTTEELHYILKDSGCKICIAAENEHVEKTLEAQKNLNKLKEIISIENNSNKDVTSLSEIFSTFDNDDDSAIKNIIEKIKPHDLATIMYTSGTTGNPKGVMLTHNNFVSNAINTMKNVSDLISSDDIALSFLPLSHVLERTAGYYIPVYAGAQVAFTENMTTILENFTEIRPTFIICVPRIYEKIRATILSRVSDASFIKKKLFSFALKTAQKNLPYVCHRKPRGLFFNMRYNLMDKLVFSKMKVTLGMDRLRYAISGGGPLSVSDAEFFIGMGIEILEGYGLTETSPITNYNQPGLIKPGTVGNVIPETAVKISDAGEICVKGPQVMKGYYNLPDATAEVFDEDGYFKTGDLGIIDDDGFLTITGRIKDIIITAGGKNISPQNIENSIKQSLFIEQIGIIGDKRKYLTALIVPSFDEIMKFAKNNNIAFSSNDDLLQKTVIVDLIQKEIDDLTQHFGRVEKIKNFTLLDAEWTQETGELTGKQSVKRRIIEEKYQDLIDAMYPQEVNV